MSGAVNEAIFRGMERRVITSATMLSNGPAVSSAARMLHRFPECSFGVHLNLTEFQPVCAASYSTLSSILDDQKRFNGNTIRTVRIGRSMLRGIYEEWCAQIEILIRLGVQPTHLDAHHHVHTIPQMLPVLVALRRRYKIDKVRISRNIYDAVTRPGVALLAKKWLYNLALKAAGFKTTSIFTDLETFVANFRERPPRGRVIELITHPGSDPPHDEEARLLDSYWPEKLSYKALLVSYKEL